MNTAVTPAESAAQGLPDYAPLLTAFHSEFATELRSLVSKLPLAAGSNVLEVAAGDGQFAVWLSERVGPAGAVTAIDVSQSWLREARKTIQNEPCQDRIQLEQADATQLPYAAESFDFVWCAQSLYSLPRLHACLAEMRRVLKPGGHVAILENDSLHHILLPWPVDLEIQILAAELKAFQSTASQPAKFYAGRWLSRLMRKTGFHRPQERSFAYTRQQRLSTAALQYFQAHLHSLRQRVQPFLSARALQRFDRLADPADRRSFWRQPDFVAVCIDRVVWGAAVDEICQNASMTRYVSHLEGAIDGTRLPVDELQSLHKDRPILVRYDLAAVRRALTKDMLRDRPQTMWRYRELLPYADENQIVSLGERMSPLLACPRLGSQLGLDSLWIKDESQLPTGSFKSRGLAMAITLAKQFGVQRVALPTAGNAGGAAAAYAARAGMECYVFMPEDTPVINQYECTLAGARTFLVNGLINDCGRLVREGKAAMNWFDLSTLKEPYRIEGKKTMGLELAEQLDWQLPDVILYPTGGGTGLIGMWKAFQELRELGWLATNKMPRMVSVQSTGCAPIVRAFEAGQRFAEPFPNATTLASGIRVPVAVGDFLILDAVRQSNGVAIAVEENRIQEAMRTAIAAEGIPICPESAACVLAAEKLLASGWLKPHEQIVLFNTGAVQKYVEAMTTKVPRLDKNQAVDWQTL